MFVCVYRRKWLVWGLRMGVARRCAKVVSMVIDVGSSPWRWIGGGSRRPRSRTKDKARVIAATQTGNRRGALQGGAEEKGAISQAKLLLGWRREKYHSNNSTRDERREGEGGGGGAGGSKKEVPNKSSVTKVIKHVYSHKKIEWQPITLMPWTHHLPLTERNV